MSARKELQLSLKKRIEKLTMQIVERTKEIRRFNRLLRDDGHGLGIIRNWREGAKRSLMATRKKIYKLQEQLNNV